MAEELDRDEDIRRQFAELAAGLGQQECIQAEPDGFRYRRQIEVYRELELIERVLQPYTTAYARGRIAFTVMRRADLFLRIDVSTVDLAPWSE